MCLLIQNPNEFNGYGPTDESTYYKMEKKKQRLHRRKSSELDGWSEAGNIPANSGVYKDDCFATSWPDSHLLAGVNRSRRKTEVDMRDLLINYAY